MRKSACLLASVACCVAWSTSSAQVGIGVSGSSDRTTVYIPIDLSKLRLEPYLRYADFSSDRPDGGTNSSEQLAVGVGIYARRELSDNFSIYYGGRVGYTNEEQGTFGFIGFGSIVLTPNSSTTDYDGYELFPSVGAEYRFHERFSLAAEVGMLYTNVDGTVVSITPPPPAQTTDIGTRLTETRGTIVLRFFF